MSPYRLLTCLIALFYWASLSAQPERLNYFPSGDSISLDSMSQTAVLDPGDLLLRQGILVTNRYQDSNVSFQLSFDQQSWASFGLAPLYSSIFSLRNQPGCYFEITTVFSEERQVRKQYYLSRGKCYSVYWNVQENCWDMKGNPCRMQ